jgi:membrane associated rhomboid family serine protease
MGIYDRDYYRQQRPAFSLRMPTTMVGMIILVNVAIYIADRLTPASHDDFGLVSGRWLSDTLAVHVGTLTQPWFWWQLITYGFVHSPFSFGHIFSNMLGLWFLGRDVEAAYGRKEFLRIYLALLAAGSITWVVVNKLQGRPPDELCLGASGAVAGIVVLYALNFPRRTLLLFFVLPMPAWVAGVLLVLYDMFGAAGYAQANVAYTVHLAGAAFAFLYYQQRWNLGRLVPRRDGWLRNWRRPKLRIHDPQPSDRDLSEQVDQILEKIHREGESSLTRKERQVLENASRQYQRKRE